MEGHHLRRQTVGLGAVQVNIVTNFEGPIAQTVLGIKSHISSRRRQVSHRIFPTNFVVSGIITLCCYENWLWWEWINIKWKYLNRIFVNVAAHELTTWLKNSRVYGQQLVVRPCRQLYWHVTGNWNCRGLNAVQLVSWGLEMEFIFTNIVLLSACLMLKRVMK